MASTRSYLSSHIKEKGVEFYKGRTWSEIARGQEKGLLLESTSSGYVNWFYIDDNQYVWWIYYDTSDGGTWCSNGASVYSYRIPYEQWVAEDIQVLIERDKAEKLSKNKYARIK